MSYYIVKGLIERESDSNERGYLILDVGKDVVNSEGDNASLNVEWAKRVIE